MSTIAMPTSTATPGKPGHALRYWSIGLVLLAILGIVWLGSQADILRALTGDGVLPAEHAWIYDASAWATYVAMIAAFAVSLANVAKGHRAVLDVVLLVVATVVIVGFGGFLVADLLAGTG